MPSLRPSFTTLPLLLLLSTSTWYGAHSQGQHGNGKPHYIQARQYSLPPLYSAPSGIGGPGSEPHFPDAQYDVSGAVNSPQLQFPGVGGGVGYPQQGGYFPNTRNPSGQQPVLIYSGAGGQPFLVNPGGLPPGTNFLIPQHPGAAGLPPGIAGLDPGVIYRDAPPPNGFNPGQPPVFVSGYPKPAHIPGGYQPPGGVPGGRLPPPIDKDAEEIPTGPGATIPPHPQGTKPQKIETFDEPPLPNNKPSDKADEPAEPQSMPSPKKPTRQRPKLNPGQRFFILNGQPLFSNYPQLPYFGNGQYQGIGPAEFYKQQYQQFQQPPAGPHFPPGFGTFSKPSELDSYRNFLYKNGPVLDEYPGPGYKPQNIFFKNVVPYGILNRIRNGPLRGGTLPQHLAAVPAVATSSSTSSDLEKSNPQSRDYEQQKHLSKTPSNYEIDDDIVEEPRRNIGVADRFNYFRYGTDRIGRPHVVPTSATKIAPQEDDDDDSDSVVIDAKFHQSHDSTDKEEDNESEDVEAAQNNNKVVEPSISQAQPGAIALAGPGGVAAAGPRGTALAGEGGLAVSSPTATAVAGPRHDDAPSSVDKKPAKKSKH